MIKPPTVLRIFSPVMLANIGFTAEPELEGKTGSTYRGVAIADGGHAINAADGFPGRVLTINQAPDASTFNIEYAMTLIKRINSVVLDGHNLLSAYAASLRDSFKIKHSATDVLGVLVENEVRYTGLLGKERPFNRYDGLTAKTVVANDANLNFGEFSDFSFGTIFRTTANTSGVLIDKGDSGAGRYTIFATGDGTVTARLDDGVSVIDLVSTTTTLNDGNKHTVMATVKRGSATGFKLYIDGALDATPADISGLGDIDETDPLTFGVRADNQTSSPFEGDIFEELVYNRAIAPIEIERMAQGVPVQEPIVGDGLNDDFEESQWVIVDNGSKDGAARVRTGAGGSGGLSADLLEVGREYTVTIAGTSNDAAPVLKNGSTTITAITTSGVTVRFTATDTSLYVFNSGADKTTDLTTFTCDSTDLVTFPLLADQWGEQTLSSSNFVNAGGGNAYDTFDGVSGTAFHAISDGTGTPRLAGTADEIPFVDGERYAIDFSIALASGIMPKVDIVTSILGSSVSDEGQLVIPSVGTNRIIKTCNSTATGVVRFSSAAGDASEYTISGFSINRLGAVAAYLTDGISPDQGKLLDASSNNLHGIYTDVESINAPAGDVRGFVVSQFDEITNHKFWQMVFNEDLDDALLAILIGQVTGCWYRDYEIAAGGFKGRAGFPGVQLGMNESGRDNPEQKFGEKPDWDITLRVTDDEGINDLEEFVRTVSGALLPAWITFDPPTDNNPVREPVFERVTLIESVLPWEFKFGQTLPWQAGLKFKRRLD